MQEEIWKDIIGYEGLYQISNLGRVKSLPKKLKCRNGFFRIKTEKIIPNRINNKGYFTITLWNNYKCKTFLTHRLIAIHFIPNIENKPCIDHIDTDRLNNSIDNLRWCTHKENMNNPISLINNSTSKKACSSRTNKTKKERGRKTAPKDVCRYDLHGKYIDTFYSATDAENKIGISQSDISACCLKKKPSAGGYLWAFSGDIPNEYRPYQSKCKKVIQYDLHGSLIKEWDSFKEATEITGVKNIYKCCVGLRAKAGGYKWKYKGEENAET